MKSAWLQAFWVFIATISIQTIVASEPVSFKCGTLTGCDINTEIEFYTTAIQFEPENSYHYVDRGNAFVKHGDPFQAFNDFTTAIILDPENAEAFRCRGQLWSNQLETTKAIIDFDEAIQLEPDHAPTYVLRGIHWALKHKWEEALASFDMAICINPNDANTYFQRAIVFHSKNDSEKALDDLETTLRLEPDHVLAYSLRGWQLMLLGRIEESIHDFNQVLKLEPRNSSAYWHRAIVRTHKRDFAKVLLDAISADVLNPRMVAPRDLAFIAYEVHHMAKGKLEKCNSESASDSRRAVALRERGIANRVLERWNEALNDLTEAIRLDQSSSLAYVVRGRLWMREQNWDQAVEDFDFALQLNPIDSSVWSDLGRAHAEKGELPAAIHDFTEAIRIDPQDQKAYAQRGAALYKQKEIDLAIADFEQVIRGIPFYEHAPRNPWQSEIAATASKNMNDPSSRIDSNAASHVAHTSLERNSSATDSHLQGSVFADGRSESGTNSHEGQPERVDSDGSKSPENAHRWSSICLDQAYLMSFANHALCMELKGEWAKALNDYHALVRLAPSDSQTYARIAWLKATCPNTSFRDGEQAVQYANQALERNRAVNNYVILAAAHAESNEFEKAFEILSYAREIAAEGWEKELLFRRQQLRAAEFQRFDDDAEEKRTVNSSEIETAANACERSDWKDPTLIKILADTYAAEGQFKEAMGCYEKYHQLIVDERDKPLLGMLEQYRKNKPYPTNQIGHFEPFDTAYSTNIKATREPRADDAILSIKGISTDRLSIAQIRLLSFEEKPERREEPVFKSSVLGTDDFDTSLESAPLLIETFEEKE